MKFKLTSLVSAVTSILILVVVPSAQAVSGTDWKAGRIIDDAIFTSKDSMSIADIQAFLNSKVGTGTYGTPGQCDTNGTKVSELGGGTRAQFGAAHNNPAPFTCLKDYYEVPKTVPGPSVPASNYGGLPIPAGAKSAANLIYDAAQASNISPKVLLVMIQKESSGPLMTDDWPFQKQYTYAMGAHCPDTAPCDPNYSGFSIQIAESAALLRYYLDNMFQPWWQYKKPGVNSILFNPSTACGSSSVNIINQSTAALYTYTPYQPNQAALNNLYGTGDSCSAYGNRNFWRIFNDWFGPTLTDEFAVIMADNGDPTQWVLENGKRYVIPNSQTKVAWGLSPKWDQPYVLSGSYISTIPNGPVLSRVARPTGGLSVYFVDSGKKYRFGSVEGLAAWGYSTSDIIDTPIGLSNQASTQGDITYTATMAGDPRTFLMDGGTLRNVPDPNIMAAWVGDSFNSIPISSDYFSSRTLGTDITSPKISDGSTTYFVDNSRKLPVDNLTSQLFPTWTSSTVSSATLARLSTGPSATYVIKPFSSPAVYIVDQQLKHHVTDPDVLGAWQSSTFPSRVTEVTKGFTNAVAEGVQLTDFLASASGNTYVMQSGIRPIPTNLVSAYTTGRTVYSASPTLISLYPLFSGVTGLVKAVGQPPAYIITDTGQLRHLTSTDLFWLWGRGQTLTELSPSNLGRYNNVGGIGAFVSDGTTSYLIESGQKHLVDTTTKTEWNLGTSEVIDSGTLNRISLGIPAPRKIQNNGAFFLVHGGKSYGTTDSNIAAIWGISDAPVMDAALIREYLSGQMLTRVASSNLPNDTRLFIVDRGVLYRLYPNHAVNLAASGPYTAVNPNSFTVQDWVSAVVKDEGGVVYAIDGGTKRLIPAGVIRDQWTYGNYANAPTMTNGFLNKLPNGRQMERAIKGTGPSVYSGENFTKRWILSTQTYNSQYAPYTQVSDTFIDILPNGVNIP